jgi:mannosyltransferase
MLHSETRTLKPTDMQMWLLLALAAGVLLRVLLIGSKSLWLDEVLSLRVTTAGLPALLAGASEGYHPPLYYAFLHFWIQLGQTEAVLRLPSALFGVLTIPLIYLLARDLGGIGVALSTAWLVALSPLLVWYSQEFRSYSLLVALAVLSSLALVRLLLRPHVGWWALYVAATVAALYTHYGAVQMLFVQVALGLVLLAQRRLRLHALVWLLLAWPLIIALYWPWLSSPPARSFFSFATRAAADPGRLLARYAGISVPTALLAIGGSLLVAATLVTWIIVRRLELWPALYRSRAVRVALFVAFVLLLVMSVFPRGYQVKRHTLIWLPFVCMTVAWFWPLRSPLSRPLAVLLALSLTASVVNVTLIPKDEWREAVHYLTSTYQPGDAIWLEPGWESIPFEYYNRGHLPVTEISRPAEDDYLDSILAQQGAIWFVYHESDLDSVDPDRKVQAQLDSRLRRDSMLMLHRITIVRYLLH